MHMAVASTVLHKPGTGAYISCITVVLGFYNICNMISLLCKCSYSTILVCYILATQSTFSPYHLSFSPFFAILVILSPNAMHNLPTLFNTCDLFIFGDNLAHCCLSIKIIQPKIENVATSLKIIYNLW